MASELLPKFESVRGLNRAKKEEFRKNVKAFSTFAWQKYQSIYPELALPPSILTVGPDFIGTGIREKFDSESPAEPVKEGIDWSQAYIMKKGFEIGTLPTGSSLNGYFDFLFEHGDLQPAFTLFVADDSEWERIKGSQKVRESHDDYIVHTYLVGSEVVEVWAFNVLNPVVRQSLNGSGSISLTTAKNKNDW